MKNGLYTYPDGSKYWHLNGKRHREDGPAVELSGGTKYWYLNGKLHREYGPAIEHPDGIKEWWLNDQEITLETRSDDPKVKTLQEYMKTQELVEG